MKTKRTHLMLALVVGVAIAAGTALGISTSAHAVTATEHCTHYNYPYSQDSNCTTKDSMAIHGQWQTTGIAYRDSNEINTTNTGNEVCVWYSNDGGNETCDNLGSNAAVEYSSGGGQAYAYCSNFYVTSGYCDTTWH